MCRFPRKDSAKIIRTIDNWHLANHLKKKEPLIIDEVTILSWKIQLDNQYPISILRSHKTKDPFGVVFWSSVYKCMVSILPEPKNKNKKTLIKNQWKSVVYDNWAFWKRCKTAVSRANHQKGHDYNVITSFSSFWALYETTQCKNWKNTKNKNDLGFCHGSLNG